MKVVTLRPSAWRTSAALLFMIASSMVAIGFTATGDHYFWPRMGALVGLVALALNDCVVYFCSGRARIRPCRDHNPLSFSSEPHDSMV